MHGVRHFLLYISLSIVFLSIGCEKKTEDINANLAIVFINDQHGQIENFGKLKHLIDQKKENGPVLVACSGDMFSGNPVVDIYEQKGFPMIDLMNKLEFDIAVLGNHEFDYGQDVLKNRMDQADFEWVCANVDMAETGIPQPEPYVTIDIDGLSVTFLGLVETNGKPGANIPSTHPLKVEGIHFDRPENIIYKYAYTKSEEDSDLYIALTHLGHNYNNGNLGDFQLAQLFPNFDLIIGGHSNQILDTVINGTPVFQAGHYLNIAGVIDMEIREQKLRAINYEAVDLNSYPNTDPEIESLILQYNESMEGTLDEVIGYSEIFHERHQLGCFYTEALQSRLNADLCFQNTGGIRNSLDEGEITVREIYEIDPFNNKAMIYQMTGKEIKDFINGASAWFAYSGVQIEKIDGNIILRYPDGTEIGDDQLLTLGINDYIPSVNDSFFPSNGEIQDFTTAEALIHYLKTINSTVNYPDCDRFFN